MHSIKNRLATFCLLALFLSPVQAEETSAPIAVKPVAENEQAEKYLLQYKFKMGEVLRYSVKHATKDRTTIEETTQNTESTSVSVKAWKVTDVLPNGEMEFIHVVESVRMSNTVPKRGTVKYDSETDKTPPTGFDQVAQAVGVPISLLRIKPDGEIVFREKKYEKQPKATEDMPIVLRLPAEAIAVGEQWARTYEVDAHRKSKAKMKVKTRRVCTLKSVKSGIATIKVEYQIITPVSPYVESQLVQKLTKGTVRFDLDAGRTASMRYDADCRVIGFAGPASSTHFTSRLEERLVKPGKRLARKKK